MYLTTRQKLGLTLMVTSLLIGFFIQLLGGRLMEAHVVREDKLTTGVIASMIMIDVHWRYGIPLAAGFGLGLTCLLWPSQRPPRIVT